MLFNIIGAGKLGCNIAVALHHGGLAKVAGVFGRRRSQAARLVKELGHGYVVPTLSELPPAAVTFITAPDDSLATIAQDLAIRKILLPGSTLIHCSGVLSSEILLSHREQNCYIASFHPLKAFREGNISCDVFQDCDCAMEGDPEALTLLTVLFEKTGARLLTINAAHKAVYHAAATMSANYLVTLAAQAFELFSEAGIPSRQAKDITMRLMQGSLDNVRLTSTMAAALTGPLARGDEQTIIAHLQVLHQPEVKAFYKAAALATLPLTRLDEEKKENITRIIAAW